MKKFLISAICLFSSCSLCNAQKAYEKSQHSLQAGHGLLNMGKTWISSERNSHHDYKYRSTGSMFVKYEYGVFKYVSVGLNFAYVKLSANYNTNSSGKAIYYNTTENIEENFESLSLNLRHNFHFYRTSKIDLFCGIGVGLRKAAYNKHSSLDNLEDPWRNSSLLTIENIAPYNIPFGYEFTVGIRYLFTKNFGVYSEAGLAKSFFQFGGHIKF